MEIAGFLGRLVDGCKQRFVEEKRVLSFGQYLALFSQRPWLLGRNAPQYLKNTIDHFGRETVARPWGNVTRYRLFDAPFDRGRDRLIGQEEVQEQFYNLLAAFVKEGKASRLILLHGPNGSAKTTFVQCLARAMVHYSGTDDGAVYRFNWVFPKSSYLGKRVGFATGNAPSVPLEDQETFAFLDESEVAAVLPCGLSDHPVFLLPKADRMALLAELQRAEGFPADFRFSDHVTHGDLSPVSRRVFDALLSAYGGDLRRVLAHVQVERFYFSRRYRQGIVTVEPQMHVDAAVRQITMDESYANLPATLRHVNMIHLSGDLVDANRGLLEFSDLLKRPVDAFKYILGTCEASRISVDGTILYLDIVFVGTTNDKYLYAFAKMPDFPSFKGRMELACVPYLRDYRTEQQIYDLLVTPEVVGKHIAPHATWAAALFAVLTRLHKPSVDRVPTAAKSLVQGLTPLEKADLYALGRAPDSARFEAARELLESLPFLRNEGRGSPDYEGSTGASPREIKQVLLAAAQHPDYACLHPVCVLDELKELLKARSLYEFLQMEPNGDYHDAGTLLQRVRGRYIQTLDRELKVSMGLVTDDEFEKLLQKYAIHAAAHLKKETVIDPISRRSVPADEKFLRELEEKWGAADHRERFRQDFMGRIASFSLSVPGTAPPYRALFADEFERLRAAYFEENSAEIKRMLRVVLDHLAGSKLDPQDDLAACNVVNRMIQGFGYCPHCVGPALAYLARKTK